MAWTAITCPRCLERYGSTNLTKAIDRFLTHPEHGCALDVIAGKYGPYTKTGVKR